MEIMYTISVLNQLTIKPYECFTFPAYQKQLRKLDSKTLAIGASLMQQPIGLAIAEISPDSSSAKVLSLFVKERYRNRHIGTKILAKLEAQLSVRGCEEIELVYTSDKPSTKAIEKILFRLNWETPKSRMLVCKSTTTKIASAPWLQKYKLASSYQLLPWVDLVPQSRRKIYQKQQEQEWYPETLNPFNNSHQLEPLNSLCLLYKGDVIGWMITHRIAPNTIRYTNLFVRKDLQKMGRAIPMLAEAIRRQVNSDVLHGIWTVAADNKPMVQFVKRRLQPYLTSLSETRGSQKLLIAPSSETKQPCLVN